MRTKLKEVKDKLRPRRRRPPPETGNRLGQGVRGFLNDLAVPTNIRALDGFREAVLRLRLRSLERRGNRDTTTLERFRRLPAAACRNPVSLSLA